MRDFFEEYTDDNFSLNLTRILMILVLGLGVFLLVTSAEGLTENLFLYLMLMSLFILIVSQVEIEKVGELVNANFFGSRGRTYASVIIGIGLGLFLGFATQQNTNSVILPTQALYLGDLRFLLANIIAPIVEPLFFRGFLYPTFFAAALKLRNGNKFQAGMIALVAAGFVFGVYHLAVFFAQTGTLMDTFTMISLAATFGIMFTLGNQLAQSVGFEFGWHFVNNLFSEHYQTSEILATIVVWFIAFTALIELTNKISKKGK